jgi:hypothetical protein
MMVKTNAFEAFAPSILRIYNRDKEAFWAAAMAPFLNNTPLNAVLHHHQIGLDILAAYQGLDGEAQNILRNYSTPLGLDITHWKSNRAQYFKDAYPIFAFLAIWMDEAGLQDYLKEYSVILRSAVFGVAGYGILDENVDGSQPNPVEILTAQALITEYEDLVLGVFGITPINLGILHKMRSIFLMAEIKEKSFRGKASPYTLDKPEDCGAKGAHVVTPFMLSLEKLGKAALIDDYWRVFLLFGAVIQVIDDWMDLEKDLAVGHYSYVTLGYEDLVKSKKKDEVVKLLRANTNQIQITYIRSKEMINEANDILVKLEDPILKRLVDVTNLRLESYFHKELKVQASNLLLKNEVRPIPGKDV